MNAPTLEVLDCGGVAASLRSSNPRPVEESSRGGRFREGALVVPGPEEASRRPRRLQPAGHIFADVPSVPPGGGVRNAASRSPSAVVIRTEFPFTGSGLCTRQSNGAQPQAPTEMPAQEGADRRGAAASPRASGRRPFAESGRGGRLEGDALVAPGPGGGSRRPRRLQPAGYLFAEAASTPPDGGGRSSSRVSSSPSASDSSRGFRSERPTHAPPNADTRTTVIISHLGEDVDDDLARALIDDMGFRGLYSGHHVPLNRTASTKC